MSLWVRSNVGGGNRWVEVGSGGGGGGSGLFPTSGTGTATGSVIGDLDGNLFQIESGGEQVFKIDIANNFSQFKARDGAGSNAKIDLFADNGNDVRIHLRADYSVINGESELTLDALNGGTFNLATNDGSISVNILGEATVNTITYTATTHIFDGGMRLLDLAGNGSGLVAVDDDGDLIFGTASQGLMMNGSEIQLGRPIGGDNSSIINVNREIPLAVTNFLAIRDTSSLGREFRFDAEAKFHIYSPESPSIRMFTNPQGLERVFPSLSYWRNDSATIDGGSLLMDVGIDLGPSTHHFYLDMKDEITSINIEKYGVALSAFGSDGATYFAGGGTIKRVRIGSFVLPTRTTDITGSFAVSDSALFPNRLTITDSTGFNVAMLNRSTGLMKTIRVDQLLTGFSSLFPTTGTGTATGNVTGSLAGNTLTITGGTLKYVDGNQASGKILTSDANGNASWQSTGGSTTISKGFVDDTINASGTTSIIPRWNFYEDFLGNNNATAGSSFMNEMVSGAGANASRNSSPNSITGATGWGYAEIETGTTTTGVAMLQASNLTNANAEGKVDTNFYYRYSFRNVIFNDLSDGTETYTATIGFGQNSTPNNSITVSYTHSVNSGAFVCTSYTAATPETTNTGVTVAADTEYDIDIEFYDGIAKFWIDGTLVATHSTSVPINGVVLYAPFLRMVKSAGGTTRSMFVDAVVVRIVNENYL